MLGASEAALALDEELGGSVVLPGAYPGTTIRRVSSTVHFKEQAQTCRMLTTPIPRGVRLMTLLLYDHVLIILVVAA